MSTKQEEYSTRRKINVSALTSARRLMLLEDALEAVRIIAKGKGEPIELCKNVLSRFENATEKKPANQGE